VDPFEDARLPRALRWLQWSFPVGRVAGIQVRLFATAFIPLLFAIGQMATWGLDLAPLLAYSTLTAVLLYVVVLTHELGHALAARRGWNIRTDRISLSALGGVAHLSYPAPSPKAEAVISLAGPATHALWLAALWPARHYLAPTLVPPAGWAWHPAEFALTFLWYTNVSLALFNLLPFFPLDGGHVLRALLATRWNANRATRAAAQVGLVGAAGVAIYSLVAGGVAGSIGLFIAISMALRCRDEMLAARHTDGPYGPRREAWESDPDAWRHGKSGFDDEVEEAPIARPAPRGLPRRGRRGATAEAPEERAADLVLPAASPPSRRSPEEDAELDRLLDRVNEVGLSGLSTDERATLERLSRARRPTGR
jgi:Zn-dependent protease